MLWTKIFQKSCHVAIFVNCVVQSIGWLDGDVRVCWIFCCQMEISAGYFACVWHAHARLHMRVTVLQGENSEDYRRPVLLLNAAGLKKKKLHRADNVAETWVMLSAMQPWVSFTSLSCSLGTPSLYFKTQSILHLHWSTAPLQHLLWHIVLKIANH